VPNIVSQQTKFANLQQPVPMQLNGFLLCKNSNLIILTVGYIHVFKTDEAIGTWIALLPQYQISRFRIRSSKVPGKRANI
jgi:hypothetical protein